MGASRQVSYVRRARWRSKSDSGIRTIEPGTVLGEYPALVIQCGIIHRQLRWPPVSTSEELTDARLQ